MVVSGVLLAAQAAFAADAGQAVGVSEVISLNFVDKRDGNEVGTTITDNNQHGMVPVPGSAWKNLVSSDRVNNARDTTVTGVTIYDTEFQLTREADDITVTWHCTDTYRWNNYGDAYKEMRGWIDDDNGYVEIVLDNIPFKTYDVYVYFCNNNGNYMYTPISFDGGSTYWTWDNNAGEAVVGNANWGKTTPGAEERYKLGTDIIYVENLEPVDGKIVIRPAARNNNCGTIAAIQIVGTSEDSEPPYARDPLTLEWIQPGKVSWNDRTVWHDQYGEDASCITGDTVFFGDVPGCDKVMIASTTRKTLAALTFSAKTTAYEINGGRVTVPNVTDTATAPVVYAGTINIDGGQLVVTGDTTKPHEYLDVRGTLARVEFLPGVSEDMRSTLSLGTGAGGTLNAGTITVGRYSDLVIAGFYHLIIKYFDSGVIWNQICL